MVLVFLSSWTAHGERRDNLLTALLTRGVPIPARILLISPIAEMQGGFANTLVIGAGPATRAGYGKRSKAGCRVPS